jgi:phage tail protein X
VPGAYGCAQSEPQLIPAGELVTVPEPVPERVTVSVRVIVLNEATHDLAAVIVTAPSAQSASPLQPANTDPVPAVALRVTVLLPGNASLQSVPQVIPAGVEVTEPDPLPVFDTLSGTGGRVKVAVHDTAADIVTIPSAQSAAPDQPMKVEPAAAVAVSATWVAPGKASAQSVPHAMPDGTLVTLPLPDPARTIVSEKA